MVYIDLDASVMRLLKRNSSPADLMHSPISNSDHSAPPPMRALPSSYPPSNPPGYSSCNPPG